jgi:AhpC/TSA family.
MGIRVLRYNHNQALTVQEPSSWHKPLPSCSPSALRHPTFLSRTADGKLWRLADLAAQKPLLVIFLCNHCPYVIHIRAKLAEVTREFMKRGVAVVGINANDAARYPWTVRKR